MILLSIEVEGFQRFDRPLRVDFDPARINLLHSANGTGKSTLLRALTRCLMDRHQVGGRSAGAMATWGKQLTPRVRVEFQHSGDTYRLEKKFIWDPSARLEIKRGYNYEPLAAGNAVNELLSGWFRADPTGAGLSSPVNWGVAGALWCPQGSLAMMGIGGKLQQQIRASLGAQAQSPDALQVEQAVREFYGEYFTPKGQVRSGTKTPDFVNLQAQLTEVLERVRALEEARDQLRGLESRVVMCRQERDRASQEIAALAVRIEDAQRQSADYAVLDAERWQLDSRCQLLAARDANLRQLLERISQLDTNLGGWESRIRDLELGLRQAEQLRAEAAYIQSKTGLAELRTRLDSIRPLASALGEAALIHLELTPDRDCSVTAVSGDPPGPHQLRGGEIFRTQGFPEIALEIPGFGRLRADALKLASDMKGARDALASLLGGESVTLLEEREAGLASRIREAEALHPEWAAAPPAIRPDSPPLEELQRSTVRLQAELQAVRELAGNGRTELSHLLAGSRPPTELRAELDGLAVALHGARHRLQQVNAELTRFDGNSPQALQTLAEERQTLESRFQSLESQLIADQAELRVKMGDAPYDRLALEQERAEDLRLRHREAKGRADAAKLLWETIQEAKAASTAGVSESLASDATRLFHWISGRVLGQLRVGDDFLPSAFHPTAGPEPVNLDSLSGGELEQVHLAARLALAKLLTEKERHLVVLDDVLTATDEARMTRILRLLEKVNEKAQILILTCHPERYRQLSSARFTDFTEVLRGHGYEA